MHILEKLRLFSLKAQKAKRRFTTGIYNHEDFTINEEKGGYQIIGKTKRWLEGKHFSFTY